RGDGGRRRARAHVDLSATASVPPAPGVGLRSCPQARGMQTQEGAAMSRHHVNLIRSIFHDPPSANLHWREIESLLRHVGAELESLSGARVRATLHRMEEVLH